MSESRTIHVKIINIIFIITTINSDIQIVDIVEDGICNEY